MRGGCVGALCLLVGCATHVTGLVSPIDGRPTLTESDGRSVRLVLSAASSPLGYLDGHLTEVWGRRGLGRLVVEDWKVREGLHGLPAYVGELNAQGIQLGLEDRNSGAYFLIDELASEDLAPFVGRTVLVEGYVEGAHRVRVLYWRVLGDTESAGDDVEAR